MEPATPQGTSGNPSSSARQHRTLQAVLLFFLILLIVLIGAMLTGAFGAKSTVSSTQATATANAKVGLSGSFANGDGSSALPGTITAGAALTPISLTPGSDQNGNASDSSVSGNSGSSNGSATGGNAASGDASGNPSGNAANGATGDTTGSLPGGTNSNPSAATASGNSTGSSNGSSTGSSNDGTTSSTGLAGSLPGGSTSGGSGNSTGGSNASGTSSGTGSSNGNSTGGATGSSTSGGSGGNAANLPTPHLGNYVCTTGTSGNLTYQSDFTILEGRKYKHSSNPNQEFSFSYDPNTQVVTWLDGPNAGTVGAYYLPDGTRSYRIVEQFPNNPQATPVSCMLAETK